VYRCGACGCCSKPGEPRRVHVVHRTVTFTKVSPDRKFTPSTRQEIAREIPVCHGCAEDLSEMTWDSLLRKLNALFNLRRRADEIRPQAKPARPYTSSPQKKVRPEIVNRGVAKPQTPVPPVGTFKPKAVALGRKK